MSSRVVISTMYISGASKSKIQEFDNNEKAVDHILDTYYNSDRWIEIDSTKSRFRFRDKDADNITIDVMIRDRSKTKLIKKKEQ